MMNNRQLKTKSSIEDVVNGYKSVKLCYCYVEESSVTLTDANHRADKYPFIAKKILSKFPEIKFVYFTGGWTTYVYSKNTLKYLGL